MVNNFQRHLYLANETYFQHFWKALGFSFNLLLATVACFIHAFFPWLFETSASDRVKRLVKEMRRGNVVHKYSSVGPYDDPYLNN